MGLLPEASVARKVDRELFILLGGTAALLMQVAHPLVAAAVDRQSDFRRDPLGRLLRTLDTTLAIVFGDDREAARAVARINGIHARVHGTAIDGRRYDALDPRLLLWVQTTLVLTALRLYELVAGPLAADERQRFWQEMRPIGEALRIPPAALPATLADLESFEREMLAHEVTPDLVARGVARDVLRPLAWVPEPVYWANDALAASLLPPSLRAAFGLRYGRAQRIFFECVVASVRGIRRLLPGPLTVVPQARRDATRRRAG